MGLREKTQRNTKQPHSAKHQGLSPWQKLTWRRQLLLRRVLIAVVVLVGAMMVFARQDVQVVVTAADVEAGTTLDEKQLRTISVPARLAPKEAATDVQETAGKVAAVGLVAGEMVTWRKLLDEQLTNDIVSTNTKIISGEVANIVPLKLADPNLGSLLHHGDQVTVVTALDENSPPQIIAAGGRIISSDSTHALIALPASDAQNVAAVALHSPLAVIITGDRAHLPPPAPE